MEPQEAASVLHEFRQHPERLTRRASGLTSMVWGLAVATIFLGYQTLSGWASSHGQDWIDGILWAPWVLMASLITNRIWNALSVHVSEEDRKEGTRAAVKACTLTGIAAAALTLLLVVVIDIQFNTHAVMLLVTAFLAACAAALQWKFISQPAMVAMSLVSVLVAVLMGTQGWDWEPSGFVAALVGGANWFFPGYLTYKSG